MVVYCIFDADDNTLRAEDYYCVSQNDNKSSQIIVKCLNISQDSGWEYYLEFRCYNAKGVPKNKYVSPKLTLNDNDWLTFAIPNCLTQYPGYVDMQLVAYMPANNPDAQLVRKSVQRSDRIFDVAPSLDVVEASVLETPNVFVEVENAIEDLGNVKLRRVRWLDYDRCVSDALCVVGKPLSAPSFTPPTGTTFVGWYCRNTGELWGFDEEIVADAAEDIVMFADYYNSDAEIVAQTMYFDYLGSAAPPIYVSFTKAPKVSFKVARADSNAPPCVAYADTVEYVGYAVADAYRVPADSETLQVTADGLIAKPEGDLLAPKLTLTDELRLASGAKKLTSPLDEMPVAVLDIGDNVRSIGSTVITSDFLQIMRIGKGVESIDIAAFYAPNLHHVIVDRMIPPAYDGIGDVFALDATLYVPEGAKARYQASEGFAYMFATIKTIGDAGEMAIVASELEEAKQDLADRNAGQ